MKARDLALARLLGEEPETKPNKSSVMRLEMADDMKHINNRITA